MCGLLDGFIYAFGVGHMEGDGLIDIFGAGHMVGDGLMDTFGAEHMIDSTYGMTLECDLAGSQWIRWKSGFLCGLSGVIAAQFVTLDGIKMRMVI